MPPEKIPKTPSGRPPPRNKADNRHGEAGAVDEVERASLALHNLRGVAIALVLLLHSSTAYLASVDAPSPGYVFDRAPYGWLAYPVIDPSRWLGFDIFCAWLDLFLMPLMFFLSGAFVWPSLERAGSGRFLARRCLRFGGWLLFAIVAVMPIALYPVYRLSAADPGVSAYLAAYRALPFTPIGPMWFLWVLLALDVVAAGLHRWGGWAVGAAGDFAEVHRGPAARYADGLRRRRRRRIRSSRDGVHALEVGRATARSGSPLARPLLYAAYFSPRAHRRAPRPRPRPSQDGRPPAGALAPPPRARRRRLRSLDAADVARAHVGRRGAGGAPRHRGHELRRRRVVQRAARACRGDPFRRPPTRARWRGRRSALPVYVLHHAPVVWMQFALLGLALPAIVKGALVFAASLAVAWGLAAGAGRPAPGFLRGSTPARRRAL